MDRPLERWEILAKDGQYHDAVVEHIKHFDYVSFVGLQSAFKPYFETDGDRIIEDIEFNRLIWTDMSNLLEGIVMAAINSGQIRVVPCDVMVYYIDGGVLDMPIAKRPPKGGYKKQRWAPAVLRPAKPKISRNDVVPEAPD